MSTLAQLATIFTVDNSQFKEGLRENEARAKKSSDTVVGHAKRMATGFRSTINSVFSLRSAVATLAGTAGIGLLIKNEMEAIDQTAKFARMIGESTEQITGLQYAAQLSAGMVDGQFNMALQRMTRRLAEAAEGTGEAKGAIQELRLDARKLVSAGPAEAFKTIAEAIQNVEDPAQRVRLAFKFFDSEGVKLVNTLNLGRDGIEKLQGEAEKLGITFSDFDASQVEAANDAIERMQKSFKATTTQLAIRLAPVLGAVADQITEMQIQSRGMFDAFSVGGKVALGVIKALADGFHTIGIGIQGIRVIALGLMALVVNIAKLWINSWGKVIDFATGGLNKLIEKANEIPGVNIPLFGKINGSEVAKQIDEIAANSIGALEEAKAELHRMMLEPLPSQAIDDFIRQVEEKLAKLREAQTRSVSSTGTGKDPVSEMNSDQQRQLESIRNAAKTELQIEIEKFEQKKALIQSFRDQNFITEAENKFLLEDLEQKHQARLAEIQSQGQSQLLGQYKSFLKSMELGAKQSGAAQLNTITGALTALTSSTATQNKKMFKLNKIAAISNAIVSTYQGMTKALEWGWPMGPIFAGLIGAAGFANVQAIRSQSFQGGGGGVAPSVVPTPAPPVTPVSEVTQPQQAQRVVNVTISGPVDRQFLKDALLPALQEEIDENDVTFISSNSAQARELARANG